MGLSSVGMHELLPSDRGKVKTSENLVTAVNGWIIAVPSS